MGAVRGRSGVNPSFLDSWAGGKSMIVSGAFFQSDARWLELGLMVLLVVVLSWGAASLLALGLGAAFRNARRPRRLRDTIDRRAPLVPGFKKRCDSLAGKLSALNQQVEEVHTVRSLQQRRLRRATDAQDQVVHEIGENLVGTRCFRFVVANRYVKAYADKGQLHPLLDPSWARGQLVEVWAPGATEAQVAVTERFPGTFGFVAAKVADDGAEKTAQVKAVSDGG